MCPGNNCQDSSQNAPCGNCAGCKDVFLSSCLQYDGTPSACLSYINVNTNDKLTTIIESLLASICDLNARVNPTVPQTVKVSLTATQIKAGTPILITAIPNPGVGKYIQVQSFAAWMNYGTTQFTNSILYITAVGRSVSAYQAATPAFFLSGAGNHNAYGFAGGNPNAFISNTQIEFQFDATSSVGDSTVDTYITYQIITL